jgi:hypothetical protein
MPEGRSVRRQRSLSTLLILAGIIPLVAGVIDLVRGGGISWMAFVAGLLLIAAGLARRAGPGSHG